MLCARIWVVGGLCGWLVASACEAQDPRPLIGYDSTVPQVCFGVAEIQKALVGRGGGGIELSMDKALKSNEPVRIILAVGPKTRSAATSLRVTPAKSEAWQSYSIRVKKTKTQSTYVVLAADAQGVLYGALDLAECVRLGTLADLKDSDRKPYIDRRGIKFNIPLDLRSPSYSDSSTSAQANIPEMWSLDFWRTFLDEMARNRFNVLSLWSLDPFPSMVKVPEFPDVALKDVLRTRVPFEERYSFSGSDMFRPDLHLKDVEVVRTMTIDQKIQFWRDVMQYAKDRGVEVYLFTWNIFPFGATGKYGITPAQDNPKTIEYYRASVREAVLTYPLLAGIGITAGEEMNDRFVGEFSKESWLWRAYGEGIRDALQQQPGRQVRLIHRFHMTGLQEITDAWKAYPGPFEFSFKYAVAHMYASHAPAFIRPLLKEFPQTHRTWLTVRNDDIYSFRWGDPAFARAFIKAMPGPDVLAGFYMGPDGYCWGREAMDLEPHTPRQLVMEKQWYSFMLWGRLSFDPTLPDDLFQRTLAVRFPQVPADRLSAAWAAASKVFPETTRFFWGNIDLKWLPEACLSSPRHKGFYTIRHFVEGECMPGEKNVDIRHWLQAQVNKTDLDGLLPPQVAENLRAYSAQALQGVAELRPLQGDDKELRLTLGDIEAFAHIGKYYAAKIDAACSLALYDATAKPEHQQAAIRHLETALEHWNRYAEVYAKQYKQPLLYNRVGWVDLPGDLTEKVKEDIEIARAWKTGTVQMPDAPKTAPPIYGN